jgi:phenylpropionate dioxygenase-like ring-hydroxylating dioxygenase large terminal subunit
MQRDGQLAILDRIMAHRAAGNTTDLAPAMYENPVEVYTDPQRYEHEVARLFRGCPIVACMTADVAEPGDYVTLSLTDVPILLARGADGVVRAFRNVCRHRGACVVGGRGEGAKSFMCPYHGWSYRLDGRLVNPTHRLGFEGLDQAGHGLAEMACGEAAGFVFIQVDGAPGTLDAAAWLGPMGPELAQLNLGSFARFRDYRSPREMNWKLMGDTFCEQYHLRYLHHASLPSIQSDNSLYDAYGLHGRMVTPTHAVAELDDKPRDSWQLYPYAITSYMIRPNTIMLVLGDFVELFQLLPEGVDRTTSVFTLYATDAATARGERYLPRAFDLLRRILDEEDYLMCEQIQRSFRSGAQSHITFGRNEPGLIHYHQSLEALLQPAVDTAREVSVAVNGHVRAVAS